MRLRHGRIRTHMAQLFFRRSRTNRRKQKKASVIPCASAPRILLEISPNKNNHRRHKPVASQFRQFRGSDAPQENVPPLESRVRESSGRRSRRQITRHHESPRNPKIPASSNTTGHSRGTSNHLCRHAQHHTNLRMAGGPSLTYESEKWSACTCG